MYQSTISKSISINGIGLHSGNEVSMKLLPAAANTGIVFTMHTKKGVFTIMPSPDAVQATELATTLRIGAYSLSTVEHLLAAISGLQIDNIEVQIHCKAEANEVPILDGSASEIITAINKVGIKKLKQPKKVAKISKIISYVDGNKSIVARPYNGLYIDYTIDFPHQVIGKQQLSIEITPETLEEIANARTFGFLKEVEYLHSKGLALGGSLANAIVLDEEGVINPDGLRYKDEFVRHKILDFIGDIAMLGIPLLGRFEVKCSGHKHNNLFLHALKEENAFDVVTLGEKTKQEKVEHYAPVVNVAYATA